MEYGIFLESHFIWLRFLLFMGALAISIASIFMAIATYQTYKKRGDLLGRSQIGYFSGGTVLFSIIAAISFLTGFTILIMGFSTRSSNPQECSSEKYVSAGYYRVVESKIVYEWLYMRDAQGRYLLDKNGNQVYGPGKPEYFELKLEGRLESQENRDLKMVRCITIPYTGVAQNHTFLRSTPDAKRMDVTLPAFAKKQSDGWWQFTETGP